jgi:hypothetical protein
MSRGVTYIATEDMYIKEAKRSVKSLRQSNPRISASLITKPQKRSQQTSELFDQVVPTESTFDDMRNKSFNIHRSPYDETLYVDIDVHFAGDITPVFDLLERFDFAAAHAPVRAQNTVEDVPDSFPDYNAGVLAFADCPATEKLFDRWRELYQDQIDIDETYNPMNDQSPLRRALWESDLRVGTLPPEYNCRFVLPGYIGSDVKILHGHLPETTEVDLSALARRFNKHKGPRLHTGYPDQRILYTTPLLRSEWYPNRLQYIGRILSNSLSQRGVIGTVQKLRDFLK